MLKGFLVMESYKPHMTSIINMSLEPIAKSKKWMDSAYQMTRELAEILRKLASN